MCHLLLLFGAWIYADIWRVLLQMSVSQIDLQTSLFTLLSVNRRLLVFKTASDSTKCCGKQCTSLDFILIGSAGSCGQKTALGHTIKYHMYVGSLGELT